MLRLSYLSKNFHECLAVSDLVSNEVVHRLEYSPVRVVVQLTILIKDTLFGTHLIDSHFGREKLFEVGKGLETLGLCVIEFDLFSERLFDDLLETDD
jgi:hypothetical protein